LITKDEARRIAVNIAKLPELRSHESFGRYNKVTKFPALLETYNTPTRKEKSSTVLRASLPAENTAKKLRYG
jgi:hypothetical protein